MNIYTPDLNDPFVIGLQEMPMPRIPEDAWFAGSPGSLGFKKTDETKKLISESMKGVKNTLGLKRSKENKERVSEARRNAPKKPCPHCGLMLQNQHYNMHIKARHAR